VVVVEGVRPLVLLVGRFDEGPQPFPGGGGAIQSKSLRRLIEKGVERADGVRLHPLPQQADDSISMALERHDPTPRWGSVSPGCGMYPGHRAPPSSPGPKRTGWPGGMP